MFYGFPCAIEQHPYLRICLPEVVVGHAEEGSVEKHLVMVADQPFVQTCEASWARKFPNGPVTFSVTIGDRLLNNPALGQQVPEIGIRANTPGHSVAVPDDGNAIVYIRKRHAAIRFCNKTVSILR